MGNKSAQKLPQGQFLRALYLVVIRIAEPQSGLRE